MTKKTVRHNAYKTTPLERALRAYFRSGANQQPDASLSGVETDNHGGEWVVLRNVNGILACYYVGTGTKLNLSEPNYWPAEFGEGVAK